MFDFLQSFVDVFLELVKATLTLGKESVTEFVNLPLKIFMTANLSKDLWKTKIDTNKGEDAGVVSRC